MAKAQPIKVQIETGIPIPYLRGTFKEIFREMKEGQSFTVESQNLRESALMAGKRSGHVITSSKLVAGGFRVWLVKRQSKRSKVICDISGHQPKR